MEEIALGRRDDSRLGTTSIRGSLALTGVRVRLREGGKAGTGGTFVFLSWSTNLCACQPGESSGSVAESALPAGGGACATDRVSPAAGDAGEKPSYSHAKKVDVVLFREDGTVLRWVGLTTSFVACSACSMPLSSISSTLCFRPVCFCGFCGSAAAGAAGVAVATERDGATVGVVDCSAGTYSTITFGACMLALGILMGAGAVRFRGAGGGETVADFGGTGGGSSGACAGTSGDGCSVGTTGAGTGDLEGLGLGRSVREAEGEMSMTSLCVGCKTGLSWKERSSCESESKGQWMGWARETNGWGRTMEENLEWRER